MDMTNDSIKAKVWDDHSSINPISLTTMEVDLTPEDESLVGIVEVVKCNEEFNTPKGSNYNVEVGDRVWVNGLDGFHEVISIVKEGE